MQILTRTFDTLDAARRGIDAMKVLGADRIKIEADGTWETNFRELVFARSTRVNHVGIRYVQATVDGDETKMKPSSEAYLRITGEFN